MDDRFSMGFLPTIKCSTCGNEVPISMMGEHICGSSVPEPAASDSEPPSDVDQYLSFNMKNDRLGRLPPQVDTNAANRGFQRPGQLTPVSNSSSAQSLSPRTPMGMRSGFGSRVGDDFAPKIAGEYGSPSSSQQQPRRPGGYGGLRGSVGGSNDDADPYQTPLISPKRPGPSLMQRMDAMAPGPFDVGRPGSSSNDANARDPHMKTPSSSFLAAREDEFAPPQVARAGTFPRRQERVPGDSLARVSSSPGHRRRMTSSSNGSGSGTPDRRTRGSLGPDTSRVPPPRTSLIRPSTSGRGVPQINLAAEFGIGNPYHSPTKSMSSTMSSQGAPSHLPFSSSESSLSSASSFSTSGSGHSLADQKLPQSSTNSMDSLMNDLKSMSMGGDQNQPYQQQQNQQNQNQNRFPAALEPSRFGPPMRQETTGDFSAPLRSPIQTLTRSPTWDVSTGSTNDNYNNSNSNSNSNWGQRPSDDRFRPQSRGRSGDAEDSFSPPAPVLASAPAPAPAPIPLPARAPNRPRDPPTPVSTTPPAAQSTPVPATPAQPVNSRGICKGCNEPITGKSVSSADGRLTGRYHKACFVCTTCAAPFTSATFYVHEDKPYCEQHYHRLNGSLCGTCGHGIEGPYLADDTDQKYHPTCFVCGDCNIPLRDGYFVVNNRFYCERDATRRVHQQTAWQQQPPIPPMSQQQMQQPMGPPTGPPMGPPMNKGRMMPPSSSSGGFPGPRNMPPGGQGLPSGPRYGPGPAKGSMPPRGYGPPPPKGYRGLGGPDGPGGFGGPGQFGGPGNRLRMEKRMTRFGMMK